MAQIQQAVAGGVAGAGAGPVAAAAAGGGGGGAAGANPQLPQALQMHAAQFEGVERLTSLSSLTNERSLSSVVGMHVALGG